MSEGPASAALREQVEILFTAGTAVGLTDRDLLERFVHHGRESGELAFATLVERHGAMVFRVCNQGLRDRHAAEDAFQVTFLVLARRASSIRKRDSLESWLFGVACRAAAHIRMLEARRVRYERRGASHRVQSEMSVADSGENWPELHSEITRLPEKYRAPIVLCYFEGLTHEQAAGRLGWPVGTVKARLARARDQLRWRLSGRVRSFAPILSSEPFRPAEGADVPRLLVDSTTRAVTACVCSESGVGLSATVLLITKGVVRGMLFKNLRIAAIGIFGVTALGLSVFALARQAPGERIAIDQPGPVSALVEEPPQPAVLHLQGTTAFAPGNVTNVAVWFDCRIDKVLVELGSRVKKGDPLLELTGGELANTKSRLVIALTEWDAAKKELDRITQSIDRSKPLPGELRAARNEERILRNSVDTWMGALKAYGLTDKEIANISKQNEIEKPRMILRSQADGVVFKRSCVPGNYYDSQDTLLAIAQDDALVVTSVVKPADAGKIKIGQRVTVTLPFGGGPFDAEVEALSSDPETGKLTLRTSIPNSDHRVKPGMSARLDVNRGPKEHSNDSARAAAERISNLTLDERLSEVERKLEILLQDQEGRSPNADVLKKLSELEAKLDRALKLAPRK